MKKFCKFLIGAVSIASLACGVYYFCKKYICKESKDDFDDLEDEYDEYESDISSSNDEREYVSINITSEQDAETDSESLEANQTASDEQSAVESE